MNNNIIITSKYCWEYEAPAHPEASFRVKDSYYYLLEKKEDLNCEFKLITEEIDEKILLLTHTKQLIEKIKTNNFFDLDTPNIKNIYFYARISANIVLEALKLSTQKNKTFALTRPPGHHATKTSLGGFCYFNNISCAINWYLNENTKKVAILDIDLHHGNGTQEIFLGNKFVLFISLHQKNIYPGTGLESIDNCINIPLEEKTDNKKYLEKLNFALKKITEFNPELLGISCGFDTFKDDPLSSLNLDSNCYYEIGKEIKKLNIPTFCVLEGGYSKKLPLLIENFLKGFFN